MTATAYATFKGKTLDLEEMLPFKIGERLIVILKPEHEEAESPSAGEHPGFGLLAKHPIDGLKLQQESRNGW